jgi:hypothetical protein
MDGTLKALNMGEFSEADVSEIATIQQTITLDKSSFISNFGKFEGTGGSTDVLSNVMEESPVNALAAKISDIVSKLSEADPRILAEKPTWLQRFTGRSVEKKVLYQVARKSLEQLLEEAGRFAAQVAQMIHQLDNIVESHHSEVRVIKIHIAAGRLFLSENPSIGIPVSGDLVFDNPRERFARKLANMAALLASHEMGLAEVKLTRAQAVDLLDRFDELSGTLVPVWRRHTLSLLNNTSISPDMLAAANKAHEALMNSLVKMK